MCESFCQWAFIGFVRVLHVDYGRSFVASSRFLIHFVCLFVRCWPKTYSMNDEWRDDCVPSHWCGILHACNTRSWSSVHFFCCLFWQTNNSKCFVTCVYVLIFKFWWTIHGATTKSNESTPTEKKSNKKDQSQQQKYRYATCMHIECSSSFTKREVQTLRGAHATNCNNRDDVDNNNHIKWNKINTNCHLNRIRFLRFCVIAPLLSINEGMWHKVNQILKCL